VTKKSALEQLATALDRSADDFAALNILKTPQLKILVEDFRTVQKCQHTDLQQAIDAALQHVPRLLRGTVLKILRG